MVLEERQAAEEAQSTPVSRRPSINTNVSQVTATPDVFGPRTESPMVIADSSHPADILLPEKVPEFPAKVFPDDTVGYIPFFANASLKAAYRLSPRNFTCLTIGSRGDVQPYIALGVRLMQDDHKVTIVTHRAYLRFRSARCSFNVSRIQRMDRGLRDRTQGGGR